MTKLRLLMAFAILPLIAFTSAAHGAAYFVADGVGRDVDPADALAMTSLVRTAVSARFKDRPVDDQQRADFVLQPRLQRSGDDYLLAIEKRKGSAILYVSQFRVKKLKDLNVAARRAVDEVIAERRLVARGARDVRQPEVALSDRYGRNAETAPVVSGATAPAPAPAPATAPAPEFEQAPPAKVAAAESQTAATRAETDRAYTGLQRHDRWTIGVGPFIGRNLDNDNALYGFAGGRTWDVHPQAAVKVFGEGAFSSGRDSSRFFDVGAGANYYFLSKPAGMPYLTGDIGYGFARTSQAGDNAEGFSFGGGLGYQFWRFSEANMDVAVRYVTITSPVKSGGYPSLLGARLAVNF